jgi:hypothetical protein
MYKYKTKNGQDMFLTGVGQTIKGEITTVRPVENPNLELVSSDEQPAAVVGTEQAQPNVVVNAQPVEPTPVAQPQTENKETN